MSNSAKVIQLNDRVCTKTLFIARPKNPELGTVVGVKRGRDHDVLDVVWDSGLGSGQFLSYELSVRGNAATELVASGIKI